MRMTCARFLALSSLLLFAGCTHYPWQPPQQNQQPVSSQRQDIPAPSILTLPPSAPLPPSKNEPRKVAHHNNHKQQLAQKQLASKPAKPVVAGNSFTGRNKSSHSKSKTPKPHVPSKWEVLNQYNQVYALDEKYYQIATQSDQYGYKSQAIKYYERYLSVAPTGPHAAEARSRLAQLQSSF